MDTGNVIINVNELKAACFDILAKGLSHEDDSRISPNGMAKHYTAGMMKVLDLIGELGKYTEEQSE